MRGRRAGDEVQLRLRILFPQVAEGIDGVGRGAAVDVDATDGEPGVGRCRNYGHQVPVLRGTDPTSGFLPGLTCRYEDHLVEAEPVCDLTGGDEVPVVDGIEGTAHDAQTSRGLRVSIGWLRHGCPAYGVIPAAERPPPRPTVSPSDIRAS